MSGSDIILFLGIGNIGDKYVNTRHNAGFMMIDAMSEFMNNNSNFMRGGSSSSSKFFGDVETFSIKSEYADKIGASKIILAKPSTYVNLSGKMAGALKSFYKIPNANIFVIQDDVNIGCGKIKFVTGGGSGGHNGIKSTDECLGGTDYWRIRLGVGVGGSYAVKVGVDFAITATESESGESGEENDAPTKMYKLEDFVLGRFSDSEMTVLQMQFDILCCKKGIEKIISRDAKNLSQICNQIACAFKPKKSKPKREEAKQSQTTNQAANDGAN